MSVRWPNVSGRECVWILTLAGWMVAMRRPAKVPPLIVPPRPGDR